MVENIIIPCVIDVAGACSGRRAGLPTELATDGPLSQVSFQLAIDLKTKV